MFTTVFEIKLYYMIYLYEGWLKTIESLKYSVFLLQGVQKFVPHLRHLV